jgi:hypothetical protein
MPIRKYYVEGRVGDTRVLFGPIALPSSNPNPPHLAGRRRYRCRRVGGGAGVDPKPISPSEERPPVKERGDGWLECSSWLMHQQLRCSCLGFGQGLFDSGRPSALMGDSPAINV